MATLTVRNVPDDAKHRFRQVAAAHGRSMEEHLRQLVIEADFDGTRSDRVAEKPTAFQHVSSRQDWVRELVRVADGSGSGDAGTGQFGEIRFMTARDAMAELRRLANGVGFDPPPRLSTELDAPDF